MPEARGRLFLAADISHVKGPITDTITDANKEYRYSTQDCKKHHVMSLYTQLHHRSFNVG